MNETKQPLINKRKRLVLLSMVLFIPIFLNAQTFFKGAVKDEKTNESLPAVTISLKSTATGTATNLDGNYQLEVAPGTYTLVASYISYNNLSFG